MLTSTVVRDTGLPSSEVLAAAGTWAITAGDEDATVVSFHAINYATNIDHVINGFSGISTLYARALGTNRFVIQQGVSGSSYILDPALLAS